MAPSKQYDEGGQLQLMEPDGRIEEEEECFESIDKLISQGINAGDVKKLQDAGIYTCNGLMMHTKKSLTGIKGLSEAKVDKICEAAEKLLTQGFMTGSDLLIKRKSVVRITTGSQALDELLGGGIETLCITEAFGEFRSGKTQLAHTLCVSTQLPLHMHGGNGKVAYIDTEGTFRPERIVPIAERFGMDANAVLDNIIYARAYTYEHQYNLLLDLAAKMAEEPFRLLIVDSVIALSRVNSSGWGELAERERKLAQMLSCLKEIAEFNVAVYITHQGVGAFTTDPKKAAGRHVLGHTATIRLMLRKGKGKQRACKIFDAPNLPEGETVFQITTGGLMDVKGSSKGLTYFSKLLAGANKSSPSPTWPWVSCRSPRTTSFHEDDRHWPSNIATVVSRNPSADGSWFDDDDDEEGYKTVSEELLEVGVHSLGLTDSCSGSNSITTVTSEERERAPPSLMEGSVAEVVDSEDPYEDFRASMERMVAAHRVCGQKAQEELLVWYLRLNERHNHALIVRSFFDILGSLPTCNNAG